MAPTCIESAPDRLDAEVFVVQSNLRPAAIRNALFDLTRGGLARARICSAYMSRMGSRTLLDAIERSAPDGVHDDIPKTVVASLDFGLTEPGALRLWRQSGAEVLVAGTEVLEGPSLTPATAFHPKLYVFDRPDGTVASLVTSANLTNRGLTVNAEVGYEVVTADAETTDNAWRAAVELAVPLTDDILGRYEARRNVAREVARERAADETDPVPAPSLPDRGLAPFGDASVEVRAHAQLWVQSLKMSGGSATQLELPRGAHRFFGVESVDYRAQNVDRIAEPTLVSGTRRWTDNPLRWHGNNQMERINLPSAANGGFNYAYSLILFRRLDTDVYELCVHPWDSDTARACVEASRRCELLFRVGQTNTTRLVGLIE